MDQTYKAAVWISSPKTWTIRLSNVAICWQLYSSSYLWYLWTFGWLCGKLAVTVGWSEQADLRWRLEWLCWTSWEISSVGAPIGKKPGQVNLSFVFPLDRAVNLVVLFDSSARPLTISASVYLGKTECMLVKIQNFTYQEQNYNIRGCFCEHNRN